MTPELQRVIYMLRCVAVRFNKAADAGRKLVESWESLS